MKSFKIISMGCFKNTVDSERMAAALSRCGYEQTEDGRADLCIINTCGFIKDAIDENISIILDAAAAKSAGEIGELAVAGCLVNRYGADTLADELPEVDRWFSAEDHDAIAAAYASSSEALPLSSSREMIKGHPSHIRYLKIAEGCSNACSYCTIPSIRGPLRSFGIADLVAEAERLVTEGAREICAVSQDPTVYGRDLNDGTDLIQLIDALERSLPEDIWLRFLYLQPSGVTRQLIERIASGKQVIPYLDMPIQHASPKILSAMRRMSDPQKMRELFALARSIRPDITLRTTCMVGFPGETKEDVDELERFIREVRFDRLGVFEFSPEEGTPAAEMPGQVPARTKKQRAERIMFIQEEISGELLSRSVGTRAEVMIDRIVDPRLAEGRTDRFVYDADGTVDVVLLGDSDRYPGDVITAEIVSADEHDVIAREI